MSILMCRVDYVHVFVIFMLSVTFFEFLRIPYAIKRKDPRLNFIPSFRNLSISNHKSWSKDSTNYWHFSLHPVPSSNTMIFVPCVVIRVIVVFVLNGLPLLRTLPNIPISLVHIPNACMENIQIVVLLKTSLLRP